MMKRKLLCACLMTACVCSMLATAQAQTAGDKLNRGFMGLTFGFLEIPGTLCEQSREKGPLYGLTAGWFHATGNLIAREMVGLYEFVSFPIPCPDNYKPYLQPPYAWDRFTSKKETSSVPAAPDLKKAAKPAEPAKPKK